MPPAPCWSQASGEAPSYCKCRVYSRKDVFPSPSHRRTLRCRGPARSPHCQPRQEPPALSLAGSGDAQALCHRPQHPHSSVSHAFLSFPPPLPGAVAGQAGTVGAAGGAMAPRVHVLLCTDCTARALDWRWVRVALCPAADPASPDAPSLCHGSWTAAFQEDSLDIQPLPVSGVLLPPRLPPGAQGSARSSPSCTPCLLHCHPGLALLCPFPLP